MVFKANKGSVTDPIRITAGLEILKVEEHYTEGQAAFEDVKNEIMEKLYMPRMEPELRKYLTRLRRMRLFRFAGASWIAPPHRARTPPGKTRRR